MFSLIWLAEDSIVYMVYLVSLSLQLSKCKLKIGSNDSVAVSSYLLLPENLGVGSRGLKVVKRVRITSLQLTSTATGSSLLRFPFKAIQ